MSHINFRLLTNFHSFFSIIQLTVFFTRSVTFLLKKTDFNYYQMSSCRLQEKIAQLYKEKPHLKREMDGIISQHKERSQIKTEAVAFDDKRLPQELKQVLQNDTVESIFFQHKNTYMDTKNVFVVEVSKAPNSIFRDYKFFYMSDEFDFQ